MALLLSRFLFTFALFSPPGVYSASSISWKSVHAYNNGAWGEFCYDLTTYSPTCGWQAVLSSPVMLVRVEVWDSFYSTSDNFVFTLTNLSFSGNFKQRSECATMNLYGPFGDNVPDVVLTWLCVCDESTAGQCKNIYSPSTVDDIGTTLDHPLLGTRNSGTNTLRVASDVCYVGVHSIVLSKVTHLVDCAAMCADLSKCQGVNYRSGAKQCDLVYEKVDRNHNLMGIEVGCNFWNVIHNS